MQVVHILENRRRAFAEVVTIDAWHRPFSFDAARVDLHADIVFGTARIGGEADSPVRFRLSVKQAEVVVVIPEREPVSIDRSSVSRDQPVVRGRVTEVVEQKTHANSHAGIAAALSSRSLDVHAELSTGRQADVTSTRKLEVLTELEVLTVTLRKTADGNYSWTVKSIAGQALEGRPWNPASEPRLKLIDLRKDRVKEIPPSVRVEVRCRREDLIIESLEVKDESSWEAIQSKLGFRNRRAAAEALIRSRLIDEGLEVNNFEDIFGEITLGMATTADRQDEWK